MHIDLTVTSVLFRGMIFFLFSYKIYKIFIKDILRDYLLRLLQDERNEQTEFVEKDTLLTSTQKRLESQLSVQRQYLANLEKKYAKFIADEEARCAVNAAEMAKHHDAMKNRRQRQQENLKAYLTIKSVAPEVIQTVTEKLEDYYSQNNGQQAIVAYVNSLGKK